MSKTGKALLTILLFLSGFSSFSQGDEKENPVLFAEFYYGGGFGKIQGLLGGVELNSQVKKMLFTLRYSQVIGMEISLVPTGFPILPIVVRSGTIKEISVLVGPRFVKNGHSTSISLGPSYNINNIIILKQILTSEVTRLDYPGRPILNGSRNKRKRISYTM